MLKKTTPTRLRLWCGLLSVASAFMAASALAANFNFPDISSLNSPSIAKTQEFKQKFSTLYRAEDKHWTEALAVKVLLDRAGTSPRSKRVWQLLQPMLAACPAQDEPGYDGCEQALLNKAMSQTLEEFGAEDLSALLSNKGDDSRSRDFLLYTTPHYHIAAHYGRFVFQIVPRTLRGVDVTRYNKDHHDRGAPGLKDLNPKKVLARTVHAIADLDEYVLAAGIDNSDIVGLDVKQKPGKLTTANANGYLVEGPLLRRYQVTGDGVEVLVPGILPGLMKKVGLLIAGKPENCPAAYPMAADLTSGDSEFDSLPDHLFVREQAVCLCVTKGGR